VPDEKCPDTFTAEAVAEIPDGPRFLLTVTFSLTELHPEDPRRAGEGFVHGRPCPCLVRAHLMMADAIAGQALEFL
jgi:hypothetical protein